MPTAEELQKFKDLANQGRISEGGSRIVADMLRRIEEAHQSGSSAWSDYSVWYISWRHSNGKRRSTGS